MCENTDNVEFTVDGSDDEIDELFFTEEEE